MRRRLVLAFVLMAVAVVVLYGGARALMLSDEVGVVAEDRVARRADIGAAIVTQAQEEGRAVSPQVWNAMLGEGERVELRSPEGDEMVLPAGTELDDDARVAERTLPDGSTLTYSVSGDTVSAQVRRAVLPLLLVALVLIPLGALVATVLARRLAKPFAELAEAARTMGTGRLQLDMPRYDVPEAHEIATALEDSGRRLDELLQRERDVAVNASHELRTPITALRLALEDVALWPESSPEVAAEMQRLVGEVDRLSEAVTTLLDARRRWAVPPTDG